MRRPRASWRGRGTRDWRIKSLTTADTAVVHGQKGARSGDRAQHCCPRAFAVGRGSGCMNCAQLARGRRSDVSVWRWVPCPCVPGNAREDRLPTRSGGNLCPGVLGASRLGAQSMGSRVAYQPVFQICRVTEGRLRKPALRQSLPVERSFVAANPDTSQAIAIRRSGRSRAKSHKANGQRCMRDTGFVRRNRGRYVAEILVRRMRSVTVLCDESSDTGGCGPSGIRDIHDTTRGCMAPRGG
jgi:hypothetical protein